MPNMVTRTTTPDAAIPSRLIKLDDPASLLTALPASFAERLVLLKDVFQPAACFDQAYRDMRDQSIVDDLDQHLRSEPIRAYHCTREPCPDFFLNNGLRLTRLDQHQDEFIERYGRLFTDCELHHMRKAWYHHFHVENKNTPRDDKLWFCLTNATCESDGVNTFFDFFGGEAIHMPLRKSPTIMAKLRKIGRPVIIEVQLPPNTTASCHSLAKPLVNAWHRTIRTDVEPIEAETFICCPLSPESILTVRDVGR